MARYDKYDRFRAEGAVKKGVDWAHINAASYVGKNRWFDEDPIKYALSTRKTFFGLRVIYQ